MNKELVDEEMRKTQWLRDMVGAGTELISQGGAVRSYLWVLCVGVGRGADSGFLIEVVVGVVVEATGRLLVGEGSWDGDEWSGRRRPCTA